MKKIFIVMLLVIASGLWNSTNGACMVPAKNNSDLPTISVSGELYERGYPCNPGEICLPCLTPALDTENGIYYLTTTDAEIAAQLDSLFNYLYSLNCICTFPTRVTGTTEQNGSFKYINISHIETGDPQPVSQENKVKSHATQWFGIQYHHDYPQSEHTPIITGITYNLGPDTLINTKLYRQIRYTNESKKVTNAYHGAIRQSEDRQEVYYIPSGIDKEYLLYNFDVELGDTVYAYAGFYDASCVEMIEYEQHQSITPAWIVQDIQIIDGRKHITVQQDAHVVEWIEGIGTKHILWPVGRGCYATGMEVQFHHTLCAADNEGNTIYSFDTDYIGIRNNCPDWTVLSQENKMSSLCDEWHVLCESFWSFSPYSTIHFALTTDTTINARHYIKLESTEGKYTLYKGALREENKKVYFVPVGSNNEYLLYAFDAQKGEQLSNVWGGGREEICQNSFDAVVTDISDDTPRIFTLTLNTSEEEHYQIQWLEGIGFMDGPIGTQNICDIADYGVFRLLCAYKEGVQVYISKYGEEFGCEFNGIRTEDADTIPLYTGDDPGSSTIDPIDPNQVVVTLNGNELNIKESSGDEINYTLVLNKNKQAPTKEQTVQANSFIHSVSIELFESGYYTLRLTNPNWDSSLVGHFQYINTAIEEVQGDERCNTKILRDGQLLIRVGERLYTPTGMQIQ